MKREQTFSPNKIFIESSLINFYPRAFFRIPTVFCLDKTILSLTRRISIFAIQIRDNTLLYFCI